MDGEPAVSVPVTSGSTNWNEYQEASADLEQRITGVHDVYVVPADRSGKCELCGEF